MNDLEIPQLPRGRILLFVLSLVAAGGVSSPQAGAFVTSGGGSFFLDTTLRATHDSNIRGTAVAIDDTLFTLRPVLSYERTGGRGSLDFSAGTAIQRYQDNDVFDSEDLFANFNLDVPPGARTSGTITASYFSGNQIDTFLNDLVDTKQYSFSGNGSYQFGGRSSFRFGGSYSQNDPGGFNRSTSQSINIGMGMQVRPDVTGFVDVSLGRSESSQFTTTGFVSDRENRSISLGLDGQLRPTLSGNISIGFQQSNANVLDTAGDNNQVIASVGLTWQARATTSVSIDASSDSSVTGLAQTISSQNLNFAITQTLGPRFSLTAGAGWRHYTYVGVAGSGNDTVSGNLDLTYRPNQQYSAGISITAFEQYADIAFQDFSRNTVSIFGSVRF